MATRPFSWPGLSVAPKSPFEREVRSVVNRLNEGKLNAVGEFSLNAGVKSATIRDRRMTATTWLCPEAQDTAGAISIASGFMVTGRQDGQATLTFIDAPAQTATFMYLIVG
jgi:hypothetical protein